MKIWNYKYLDIVTVTGYHNAREIESMKIGDRVKFIDGLYDDEIGAEYIVLEINGDRGIIEYICDLPIPPQSVAKMNELEVINQKVS